MKRLIAAFIGMTLFLGGCGSASATENNNSIGHTRVGFTVELLIGRDKSQFLDSSQILFVKFLQNPHALVGIYLACSNKKQ